MFINRNTTNYVGFFANIRSPAIIKNFGLLDINVTGKNCVGGLIGCIPGGFLGPLEIKKCYLTGKVTGEEYVGGLVGTIRRAPVINYTHTDVNVSGFNYIGGLAGEQRYGTEAGINNSYSQGTINRLSGNGTCLGGFVGRIIQGCVANSYSIANIRYIGSTNPTNKGFCGYTNTGVTSGCFWDNQTSGQKTSDGSAIGHNTSAMKNLSTFTSAYWDIADIKNWTDEVWYIQNGKDYPRLSWESNDQLKPNPPINFTANSISIIQINLAWIKGNRATHTVIQQKTGNYPINISDGKNVYNSTGSYCPNIALTANTTYYYRAWSWNSTLGLMSNTNASAQAATHSPGNDGSSIEIPEGQTNKKPIADASAGEPYQGTINSSIIFNGSASYDPDGNIINWYWEFGDNTNGSGIIVKHIYLEEGTYNVTLTVTDTHGAINTTITICFITQPNKPPTQPIIAGLKNGITNVIYTYTAFSIDPDDDEIKYTFNWDDSIIESTEFVPNGTSISMNHSWIIPGEYTLIVIVTDNQTISSSQMIITITNEIGNKATTPDFQIILVLCAIAFILFWKTKRFTLH